MFFFDLTSCIVIFTFLTFRPVFMKKSFYTTAFGIVTLSAGFLLSSFTNYYSNDCDTFCGRIQRDEYRWAGKSQLKFKLTDVSNDSQNPGAQFAVYSPGGDRKIMDLRVPMYSNRHTEIYKIDGENYFLAVCDLTVNSQDHSKDAVEVMISDHPNVPCCKRQ